MTALTLTLCVCVSTATVVTNLRFEAAIERFLPYEGFMRVSGDVTLRYTGTEMIMDYNLKGLQPHAQAEGEIKHSAEISIHSGTDCTNLTTVWEQYVRTTTVVYTADSVGFATGSTRITKSSGLLDIAEPNSFADRAVLVYDRDGAPVACGLLRVPWRSSNLYAKVSTLPLVRFMYIKVILIIAHTLNIQTFMSMSMSVSIFLALVQYLL